MSNAIVRVGMAAAPAVGTAAATGGVTFSTTATSGLAIKLGSATLFVFGPAALIVAAGVGAAIAFVGAAYMLKSSKVPSND